MQSHIHKVHACLAVTCHLHFWQNDRDLLRATAVTRGWNGYRNKSQLSYLHSLCVRAGWGVQDVLFPTTKPCIPSVSNLALYSQLTTHTHTSQIGQMEVMWICSYHRQFLVFVVVPCYSCSACQIRLLLLIRHKHSRLLFFRFIGPYYNDHDQYYLQHHKAIKTTAVYLITTQNH